MPEHNESDHNSSKSTKNHSHASDTNLRWIAIALITLLAVLLFISVFLPNMTERVKFFTVNALSLSVLAAIMVQTYIYRRQWEAMQQQHNAMQKQLDAMMYGQRAYITISSIDFKSVGETMGTAKFELKVENAGNTPASNVNMYDTGSVRECLSTPVTLPSTPTKLGVIAPQRYALHIIDLTKDMPRLQSEKSSYHRHGVIHYTDIFGEPHTTKFCFELGSSIGLKWYPCKEGGNEAD